MSEQEVVVEVNGDTFIDEGDGELFESDSPEANDVSMVPDDVKTNDTKTRKSGKTVRGYGAKTNVQKKKIQCTVENCLYSTPYPKDLARHMRKHTGEKPFQCQECTKAFSRNDKLKMHMMTHDSIKPYECDTCSYATVDPGSLRKHQRTHTNERPFKCQLCPYQGKDSSQLVVHLRHHTGDTPYSCLYGTCTAAFKTPSDLQRHIRLHTGEKPYKCPYCEYTAAVKCNLNTHVRRIHKDIVEQGVVVDAEQVSVILTTGTAAAKIFPDSTETLNSINETTQVCGVEVESTSESYSEEQVVESSNGIDDSESELMKLKPVKSKVTTSKKKFSVSFEHILPFQYACRACPIKCDNYDDFARHLERSHKDILKVNKSARAMVLNSGKAKRNGHVFKPQLTKSFQCITCSATFAREDSLRCHIKQHVKNNNLSGPPSLPSTTTASKSEMDTSSCLTNPETFLTTTSGPTNITALLTGDSTMELPLVMHRTAVIDGQTQYVIVRHETSTDSTFN